MPRKKQTAGEWLVVVDREMGRGSIGLTADDEEGCEGAGSAVVL
jgi:hypothetical protein